MNFAVCRSYKQFNNNSTNYVKIYCTDSRTVRLTDLSLYKITDNGNPDLHNQE